MRTVLFICTGNTCRSPMAEAIARRLIDDGRIPDMKDVFIASAGVSAGDGSPVTFETLDALRRMGIEHHGRSTPLSAEMVRRADLVLCMTGHHAEAVRGLVGDDPDATARVATLDPAGDIEDPIGMGQDAYDRLAERLIELIPRRLEELLQP